jgi:hypothetical protein
MGSLLLSLTQSQRHFILNHFTKIYTQFTDSNLINSQPSCIATISTKHFMRQRLTRQPRNTVLSFENTTDRVCASPKSVPREHHITSDFADDATGWSASRGGLNGQFDILNIPAPRGRCDADRKPINGHLIVWRDKNINRHDTNDGAL